MDMRRIVPSVLACILLAVGFFATAPAEAQLLPEECDVCKLTVIGLFLPIYICKGCVPAIGEVGYTFCNDLGVPSWRCCDFGGEFCEEIYVTP